jgi:acyl dehydratase
VVTLTLDQLERAGGLELGTSSWMTMGQDRINSSAETTKDRQWIHVDAERAATSPFGTTIAHGYLTLSLVSAFLLELLEVTDADAAVNYGLDRVRFINPVPAGARLRGRAAVVAAEAVTGGVQITSRFTLETDTGDRPAAVADVLTRFRR